MASVLLQVNIDIQNNTDIGATILDYGGKCSYTKRPSLIGTGGHNTEIYANGKDDVEGSFVLDFHPEKVSCKFDFNKKSFTTEGKFPQNIGLGPVQVQREGFTMIILVILQDPPLEFDIDIYNNTSNGATIGSYEGCTFTKNPSILGTGGTKTKIYATGKDAVKGSFVLDFHPEKVTCKFDFKNQTFKTEGSFPRHVALGPVTFQKEGLTVTAVVILQDG